jgi:nitronate monooxygenase
MAALSPAELVAAVSNAGGLGVLGLGRAGATLAAVAPLFDWLDDHTDNPYGANFIVAEAKRPERAVVELAARRARVVDFFYGTPDRELVSLVHEYGALVDWQVGSLAEAVEAEKAGCDFIVAQGSQAGGHVRGNLGTFELLAEVIGSVSIPVLAAGGIATATQVAKVLAAGADGVRIGTRFAAAIEANAHPDYVAVLIAAGPDDTVLTSAFNRSWPDAPHRVLRSALDAANAFPGELVGERRTLDGLAVPVYRFDDVSVDRHTTGSVRAMSLWAGTGVGEITRLQPAAEIVRELMAGQ